MQKEVTNYTVQRNRHQRKHDTESIHRDKKPYSNKNTQRDKKMQHFKNEDRLNMDLCTNELHYNPNLVGFAYMNPSYLILLYSSQFLIIIFYLLKGSLDAAITIVVV